ITKSPTLLHTQEVARSNPAFAHQLLAVVPASLNKPNPGPSTHALSALLSRQGGSAVPTSALTCATSTELIAPFAFTSSRKFEPLTATPTCDLVRLTSEALT